MGVKYAPSHGIVTKGKLLFIRSRSTTVPPGFFVNHFLTNIAVSPRDIEWFPRGLYSTTSKVGMGYSWMICRDGTAHFNGAPGRHLRDGFNQEN